MEMEMRDMGYGAFVQPAYDLEAIEVVHNDAVQPASDLEAIEVVHNDAVQVASDSNAIEAVALLNNDAQQARSNLDATLSRTSGDGQRRPPGIEQLLEFLEASELSDFQKAMKAFKEGGGDIDTRLDYPHYETLLLEACNCADRSDFVRPLLEEGADPNFASALDRMAPIHLAALRANHQALQALLFDTRTDINATDSVGNTALHVLAPQEYNEGVKKCLDLLLNKDSIQVNITNYPGNETAIYIAAKKGRRETVEKILATDKVDLDIDGNLNKDTARNMIIEKLRMSNENLPVPRPENFDHKVTRVNKLYSYLSKSKYDDFINVLNEATAEEVNQVRGKHSLLQLAAQLVVWREGREGLLSVVRGLLGKEGLNHALTTQYDPLLPSLLAATSGHADIIELLLSNEQSGFTQPDGQTALHVVVEEAKTRKSKMKNYRACFHLLLEDPKKLDINARDKHGDTALHIAARNGDEFFIFELLKNGAHIGIRNSFGDLPLANMSPITFEKYLDRCFSQNKSSPRDTVNIEFDYKFLISNRSVPDCETLIHISENKRFKHLLKHPICTSFLELKWQVVRLLFYLSLIFYAAFVVLVTVYTYEFYIPSHISNSIEANTTYTESNGTDSTAAGTNETTQCVLVPIDGIGIWITLLIFSAVLMQREINQFKVLGKKYIRSMENHIAWLQLLSVGLLLFTGCTEINKDMVSAIAMLLSWLAFALILGRLSGFSSKIEMLKDVSLTIFKSLVIYSAFIIPFALAFYSLFRDDKFLKRPGTSIIKVLVMMTGEFELEDFYDKLAPTEEYEIFSTSVCVIKYVIFVLFISVMAIALFNLLIGLAVSDTQALAVNAELVAIIYRIYLIHSIDSVFPLDPECSYWRKMKLPYFSTLADLMEHINTGKIQVSFQDNGENSIVNIKGKMHVFKASIYKKAESLLLSNARFSELEKERRALEQRDILKILQNIQSKMNIKNQKMRRQTV